LSGQTLDVLRRLQVKRAAETLRRGWGERPPWLFPNEVGAPLDASKTRKIFARILKAAELPGHFTPHSLRHTFASLLLQGGESPAYVQRQLGHASIQLTVDTYGRWLPMGNTAAVDRLDDAAAADSRTLSTLAAVSGAEVAEPVATGIQPVSAAARGAAELRVITSEPCGTRTHDPLIKSQVLYRLS